MPASHGWRSVHLHFDGEVYAESADRVILEVVAPVAAECLRRRWARRFFFVRYGDGGPHVRFRLLGRHGDLDPGLRSLLAARTEVPGGPVREVAWVPYQAEVERYGGAAGVAIAERLFDASSRTAIAALRKLAPGDRPGRLGKGLLATLVLLHAFLADRAAAAAHVRAYGEGYLGRLAPDPEQHRHLVRSFERGLERQADTLSAHVEAAWAALEAGGELPVEMARYRRSLAAVRSRLHAAGPGGRAALWRSIVPSYLHMTSNRLGVSVQEEAYLSLVAGSTLAAEARATA